MITFVPNYLGPIPWIPRAACYDPTNLNMAQFPLVANSWGTKCVVPGLTPGTCTSPFLPWLHTLPGASDLGQVVWKPASSADTVIECQTR
jgi:hypothetical protein